MVSKQQMTLEPHDPESTAAFVEGRLAPSDAALVRAHAADCEACREVIAALVQVPEARGSGARTATMSRASRYLLPLAATLAIGTVTAVLVLRPDGVVSPPGEPAHQPPATAAPPRGPEAVTVPAPPTQAPPQPAQAPDAPAPADDLQRRRGGERTVAGKTFRLEAGEWTDTAFDPLRGLPEVDVPAHERAALLARIPGLRPYAALGPRVLVVHAGTIYRFQSP